MRVFIRLIVFTIFSLIFTSFFLGAETLEIAIRTVIEKPDCQSGMKSTHTITIDSNTRVVDNGQNATGTTNILGCDFGSINDSFKTTGHYQTEDSFKFVAVGKTATIVSLGIGPSIDYEFTFNVNTKNQTVTISGAHDGYPTYYVEVNGKNIYKFHQTSITKLAAPLDVQVSPKTVTYLK